MINLKTKYEKLLVLIDQLVLYCHKSERLKTKYLHEHESICDDINIFYPRF